ncbi:MAG TPA: hypothetical protein DDZ41_08890 [Flavobacterium sp.]|nr:hypothetical protein [Flavobacterium sp.]
MKTIEFYLNIIHFCYYKAHYKLHLLSNKINPFRLIAEIPIVKRKHKKMGIINFEKEIDNLFWDKTFGISVTFSGGYLMILMLFFVFGVFSLIRKIFTAERLYGIHFVFFVALSAFICYVFVLKKNKYIPYFNKFEKWNKVEKKKYGWFTFVITIAFFYLCILGF